MVCWRKLMFVLVLLLFSAAASFAQTSGIAGIVRDSTGGVLPGVTVQASSPALIEQVRAATTDSQGRYNIVDLPSGTYAVTFTLPGFTEIRREGVQLTANFTARVDGDLRVGALEETLTVSGASPVVDVRNAAQQTVLSQQLLDTVPTGKNVLGFAALIPAAVTPADSQDVGGARGESSVRMAIHGAKQLDQRLLMDGMRYNNMASTGSGRSYFINTGVAEETVVSLTSGGDAESATGGVQVNLIPKSGGNQFTGFLFSNYTAHQFQSSNLSSELNDRGLTNTTGVRRIYDMTAAGGGPLQKDRIWFYTAHRKWGDTMRPPNWFYNADVESLTYSPDRSRPADYFEHYQSHAFRATAQLTQKMKVAFFFDYQMNCNCFSPNPGVAAAANSPEAINGLFFSPDYLMQGTWTYVGSDKLLFEAGITRMKVEWVSEAQLPGAADEISIFDQALNIRYRAPVSRGTTEPSQTNQRFSMSYVTGSHRFKTGVFMLQGVARTITERSADAVTYTFSNGRPIQLTQYAAPITTEQLVRPEFGIFAEDQWTIDRLTLNAGLRFDYFRAYVPPSSQPAGRFVPARSFSEVDCVPCWKDISPRAGIVYDVFGDAKTAVKVSAGRYLSTQSTTLAAANDPVNTSVNQVNRAWTDSNLNFFPDCDLNNPLENGECRQISDLNFGGSRITTTYDPAVLNGWHARPFNWQTSATVEHQLTARVAVMAGYSRTWYGNFTVTDNLSVEPADFDPYCITVPSDPRLPNGGSQICGLYNIDPSKFGQVDNFVTFASNFGEQSETYNGVDVGFTTRLPRGILLSGGWNMGNQISTASYDSTSSTKRCFVVDSPQELYQCAVPVPYQSRLKLLGSVTLPWSLQLSGTFQSLPGAPIPAIYNVPNAQIAPSLGRNLAGGAATAPVALVTPYEVFEDRINQLDLRVAKQIRAGRTRFQAIVDIYNALNASAVLSSNPTYGPRWSVPTGILDGRLIKIGAQVDF
jgi:hypothetical protein